MDTYVHLYEIIPDCRGEKDRNYYGEKEQVSNASSTGYLNITIWIISRYDTIT
jgi:hypothetical protein